VDNGTRAEQISVLAGTSSLKGDKGRIGVRSIFVNEQWCWRTNDFDAALLQVDNLAATPILGLSPEGEAKALMVGATVTVAGWGALERFDWMGSESLQVVDIPYVSNATCNGALSYSGAVTGNMLCVGRQRGGADACGGDSGGPATISVDHRAWLVGVVSWGGPCGAADKYGVYTRAAVLGKWVGDKTGGDVSW
jgi:secreted trypsin-like serine protease